MSIIYNGTEIENITYNGNNIDTVNYNNTEVYVSTRSLTVNKDSNISSIIINGTTYFSNTTVNIKPGTSVTLDCNILDDSTSGDITTTYTFVNWTGYSTNSNKSFTFTMPNENITYTANSTYSKTMNWPSSGNISEDTFLVGINAGSYYSNLRGRYVTLTEGSTTHNWLISRVNSDSYDLWYKGSIGYANWKGTDTDRYWVNQPLTPNSAVDGKDNPRYLCSLYRYKLSNAIINKLKTGLNANCGSDKIVILSYRQLGGTDSVLNDDNSKIPYFSSDYWRKLGFIYWTTSADLDNSKRLFRTVKYDGTFNTLSYEGYQCSVVPAIRVG